jgi:hypothetical protein
MLWAGLLTALFFWVLEATIHSITSEQGTITSHLLPENGHELWSRSLVCLLFIAFGVFAHLVVARINRAREEQQRLQARLEKALMKVLSGFIPICAGCKRIRQEGADPEQESSWYRIESYLKERTGVEITHSICPACEREFYWKNLEQPSDDYDI